MPSFFAFIGIFVGLLLVVSAQAVDSPSVTSLYIPGFNVHAQSVIGTILGVDGGRTTWLLDDRNGKTVTLVSGAGFATATMSKPGGIVTEKACSVTLGLALCATSTAMETAISVETPTAIRVQIADSPVTSSSAPSSSPLSSQQQPSTELQSPPAPASQQLSTALQTASQTSKNTAAQQTSTGTRVTFSPGSLFSTTCLIVGLVSMLLLV